MTTKETLLLSFLLLAFGSLKGQPAFHDLVVGALGSDQELVNGIQFSNHYGRIDGQPYFLDGKFREGSVYVNSHWYQHVMLRYNLYSQKVEIEYRTAEGHLNQFMSVAEKMSSFTLNGHVFMRLEFPDEESAYYQVISSGSNVCYIAWKKNLGSSKTSSNKENEFTLPKISYSLKLHKDLGPVRFHNRKTFKEAFPEQMQKEISKLVKQQKFSFKHPTVIEVETLIRAALQLYEGDSSL
jgi:hypothetical protein